METKKYKRVFAPVDNVKFNKEALYALGDKVVFVCPVPMFDDVKDRRDLFERYIHEALKDYHPHEDAIADFGDSMIFAMMAFYLAVRFGEMEVARYNRRTGGYTLRWVSTLSAEWQFEMENGK